MKNILLFIVAFISFISTSFANNILSDYNSNGVRYFSKGHVKSFDLNVEIKYPNNWTAKEGLRPHIVQKFVSKDGVGNCVLLIQKLPEAYSSNDWFDATKDIDGIKEAFFSNIKANDLKIIPTQYSGVPGNLIEFNSKMSQAGLTMFMNSVQHNLYYKDNMISLQCYIGGQTKQISQKNMDILYPLFRAMGNDIILHNIYAEQDIANKTTGTTPNDNNEIDNSFLIISLFISIIFTWGIGLLIPLIIRLGFKKRLSKGLAILVVSIVWLIQFTIAEILANGQGNHRHPALLLVALVGYNMIVKKEDKNGEK